MGKVKVNKSHGASLFVFDISISFIGYIYNQYNVKWRYVSKCEPARALIRCYTSRVENGHTVPSIETLAKYAQALDIPLYQIFYDGEAEPKKIKGLNLDGEKLSLGERREIESLGRKFTKLEERDKGLVRLLVAKLAQATS